MGYTNFGKYLWNPAELVVEKLNGSEIEGCKVVGKKLPVSFDDVKKLVRKYLNETDPDIAVGIGLNPSLRKVALELASSNVISFEVPDEKGHKTPFDLIDGNEIQVVRTLLPVPRIVKSCSIERNLPLRPTVGIGSYLCNVLGYLVMSWVKENDRYGGFVHVPPHTDLAIKVGLNNFLSLNEIIDVIECILEETIKEVREKL